MIDDDVEDGDCEARWGEPEGERTGWG